MTSSRFRPAMAVLAFMGMSALATIAQADPSGKWRIEFGSHADNNGKDVVIGRKGKTPKFEVTLAGSTLTGLEVKIGCE